MGDAAQRRLRAIVRYIDTLACTVLSALLRRICPTSNFMARHSLTRDEEIDDAMTAELGARRREARQLRDTTRLRERVCLL
jgi:hypothetical protein